MDEKRGDFNYGEVEEEEEYDEGMEERFANIEKKLDIMKDVVNEGYKGSQRQAFNREIGRPEPIGDERFVTSDEVEKLVIDETKEAGKEFQFERLNPEGTTEKLTDEQFKEEIAIDSVVENSIENTKLGENLESYNQPEIVQEWEDRYHSEQEQVLSPEALDQLQESMDSMAGLESVVETVGDPISVGSADDLGSELGSELGTEFASELDADQDEDADLDMGGNTDSGSNI